MSLKSEPSSEPETLNASPRRSLIITMIKWIRTSRLSIKNSLSRRSMEADRDLSVPALPPHQGSGGGGAVLSIQRRLLWVSGLTTLRLKCLQCLAASERRGNNLKDASPRRSMEADRDLSVPAPPPHQGLGPLQGSRSATALGGATARYKINP